MKHAGFVRLALLGAPAAIVASLGLASAPASADPPPAMAATAPLKLEPGGPPRLEGAVEAVKGIAPLSTANKLKLLQAQGLLGAESDLDAPMKLDVRTPWLGHHAYLTLEGRVVTQPTMDPPQILLAPKDGSLTLHFRAEPNRSYLVDCGASQGKYDVTKKITRGDTVLSTSTSSIQASDKHVNAVIAKDTSARRVEIRIVQPTFVGQVTSCEITPMK